jgi:hypothetical protein
VVPLVIERWYDGAAFEKVVEEVGRVGVVGLPADVGDVPRSGVADQVVQDWVGELVNLDIQADGGEVVLEDLGVLNACRFVAGVQHGRCSQAWRELSCLGEVGCERVDRDVVVAGDARGQVLVGGLSRRPQASAVVRQGGSVDGVVDGLPHLEVAEQRPAGVQRVEPEVVERVDEVLLHAFGRGGTAGAVARCQGWLLGCGDVGGVIGGAGLHLRTAREGITLTARSISASECGRLPW